MTLSERALKWLGGLVVVLSVMSTAGGAWWYLQADELRNEAWYQDDQRWNAELLHDLADLKTQLEVMERDLIVAIDRHEEFVSTEHRGDTLALLAGQAELGSTVASALLAGRRASGAALGEVRVSG